MNSKVVIIISLIVLAGVVGATLIPIMAVENIRELFSIEKSLSKGYFTWSDIKASAGDTIRISFTSNANVYTFLFTESQYNNFKNSGDESCLDSQKNTISGVLSYKVVADGTYYCVVSARNNPSLFKYVGTLTTPQKITVLEYLLTRK